MGQRKERQSNMELLRIVAMLMVVSLHYLGKGGLLKSAPFDMKATDYVVWILEAFCIVAVNVYVLISGYFMIESTFRWKKVIALWLQIAFYSVLVPVFLVATGILKISDIPIHRLLMYLFPVLMEHYWFATSFVFLYLFSPFLTKGIRAMSQIQHRNVTIGMLTVFSLIKSILPITLDYDTAGYDVIWFICLYLVASYIRLYGIHFFSSLKKSLLIYVAAVFSIFGWMFVMNLIGLKTGSFTERIGMSYEYNHLLVLLAAVALFYVFFYIKNFQGKLSIWIIKIAEGTFGVYLLHEHIEIRDLWPQWFGVNESAKYGFSVIRYIITIILVFLIGIIIDAIRRFLFGLIGKLPVFVRIIGKLDKIQ